MILTAVGTTLIALTAGIFLLAKTNKDNLGWLFKVAAYFIIVASLLALACSGIHSVVRFYQKGYYHEMKMDKGFMKGGMEMMPYHHGMGMMREGWGKCCICVGAGKVDKRCIEKCGNEMMRDTVEYEKEQD